MRRACVGCLIGLCAHIASAEILYTCEKDGRRTFRSAQCAADESMVGRHDMDPYAGRGPAPVVQIIRPTPQQPTPAAPRARQNESADHERQVEALRKQLRHDERMDALRGKPRARTLRQDR